MAYLICNHCQHPNEVKSEYLTFCDNCGKKITNNFNDWIKENPDRSFRDFKSIVCRTSIIYWEPEIKRPGKTSVSFKHILMIVASAAVVVMISLWGTYKGPDVAENIEEWAAQQLNSGNSDTDAWETVIIKEGNFQVKLPGIPKVRKESTETVMGIIEHVSYLFEPGIGEDDNLAYEASFLNYPMETINQRVTSKEDVEELLGYTSEGLIRSHRARLVSEKNISYGLFPGKEIRMDYNNGLAEIKCRLYLVDNTLYTLKVTAPVSHPTNKARDYFLNSFKLLKYALGEIPGNTK